MEHPRSRTHDLRVTRGDDGTLLIYDVPSDTGHALNASVSAVYELADGTRSVAQIAARLPDLVGLPADEEVVVLALQELGAARLLETPPVAAVPAEITRRNLIARLALTAGAAVAMLPGLESVAGLSRVAGASSPRARSASPRFSGASDPDGYYYD